MLFSLFLKLIMEKKSYGISGGSVFVLITLVFRRLLEITFDFSGFV